MYFDITYYLGKRGVEGLRFMRKDSFEIKQNIQGHEYMQLKYYGATKKSDGTNCNEINDGQIILSQANSPNKCPVRSFKFYLTKLTSIDALFQQPNPNIHKTRHLV